MSPHRRSPRGLAQALEKLQSDVAPVSTLARVHVVWDSTVGSSIAAVARPESERGGVLVVMCETSSWAQELALMEGDLLASLNNSLGAELLTGLRLRVS